MARARPCVASESPAGGWKGFATRRTTRPSAKVPTTRQCSSLPRQSRIALETSLLLKSRPHFFVCQSSITNSAFPVALQHGRFHSSVGQLLISIFPNRGAFRQFLGRIFSHRHSANAPRIERHINPIRHLRTVTVSFFQKLFHHLSPLPLP